MEKKLLITIVLVVIASLSVAGCTTQSTANPTPAAGASSANSPTPSATQTQATPTSSPASVPTTPQLTVATPAEIAALPTTPPVNLQSYTGPFVGSINSNVYHYPWCWDAKSILAKNLVIFPTLADACAAGYRPSENCNTPACGSTPTPTPTPTPSPTPTPTPTPAQVTISFNGANEISHGAVFELSAIVMQGNTPVTTGTVTFSLAGQTYTATQTDSSGIAGRWTSPQFSPITQVGPYTATASYTGPAGTASTTLQITVT
jgi:hypothetical protein